MALNSSETLINGKVRPIHRIIVIRNFVNLVQFILRKTWRRSDGFCDFVNENVLKILEETGNGSTGS
jgi:hypothetical protein